MSSPGGEGRVAGKVALVTGANGGIGAEICRVLAREGAQIAPADLMWTDAAPAGEADRWDLDVTDETSVKSVVEQVVDRFGRVDVLVNVAGITGPSKPTHELTVEEFDRVMDINVKGTFLCHKHVLPAMMAQRSGSIVDIGSTAGLVGGAMLTAYHASKSAVRLLAKADAMMYAEYGIRVNALHPGSIETPLSRQVGINHPDGPEAYNARIVAGIPVGHRGDPSDIAYGVVYLASDEAKFVTGTELVIDGGSVAK